MDRTQADSIKAAADFAEKAIRQLRESIDALVEVDEPAAPVTWRVTIPGTFTADYDNGHISGWTFTPAASSAGYRGPSAFVDCADPGVDWDDELTVEADDGPFWTAVQTALEDAAVVGGHASINVEWVE